MAEDSGPEKREALTHKVMRVTREDFQSLRPRLLFSSLFAGLIPRYTGARLRTLLLRLGGLKIGAGTVFLGVPVVYGSGNIRNRLQIGRQVMVNIGCVLDLNAPITIEDHVAIGHEVMLLTSSHRVEFAWRRAGQLTVAPVLIKGGAWLGARCVVLPGVTIGAGSVVAAGAVVNRNVPDNTLVAGVPARIVRELEV